MFFLRNRRADRYAAQIVAGHPLDERIRAEVLAEVAAREAEEDESVLLELNARLDAMREREEACRLLLLDDDSGEDAGGDIGEDIGS